MVNAEDIAKEKQKYEKTEQGVEVQVCLHTSLVRHGLRCSGYVKVIKLSNGTCLPKALPKASAPGPTDAQHDAGTTETRKTANHHGGIAVSKSIKRVARRQEICVCRQSFSALSSP